MKEQEVLRRANETLRRENEALRECISTLSAVVLRMSGGLDLDTVLHEAIDGARALTGAACGVITILDDSGQPEDYATSGFTEDERPQLPDVRSLADSADLMASKTFHRTLLRHQGRHVGDILLADKDSGGEPPEDEQTVLVLFASQAATAIANARAHREERRVRADLEALVDTCPVGVVVLDARTARPVYLNREARRIAEGLCLPDRALEDVIDVLRCRFSDGREVALHEFPLVRELSNAQTVLAEEIVLFAPDGRSVRTLINATPVRSGDGVVESVVVTMQDLAPLEELARLQAEFLNMVSHELRTPLAAIQGSAGNGLRVAPALDPAEVHQFFRIINEQADHAQDLISDLLDAGRIDSGTLSVAPEPSEVAELVEGARNAFLGGGSRHAVLIDLPRDLPRVLADRRRIVQVLNNLLSNAARHSPESSPIRVEAACDGVYVAISVSDQGRGVPPEQLPHLFQKHTVLAKGEDQRGLGASGLGLVISKGLVEAHGGRIWAASGGLGQGMQFTFTVPMVEEAGDASGSAPNGSHRLDQRHEPAPILVVDDDPETLRYVRDALAKADYSPIVTGDHRELSRIIKTEKPRLVLLDLLLPGTDGIELMESVPELADLPVIFISAYRRDETIARALESGAADYIVKPFSPTELTARIRAALRRRAGPESFVLGDLAIHYEERRVSVAGRAVKLTATEYDMLRVLSVNAGRVTTYESLFRQLWDGQEFGDPRLVRNFIKNLRRKLGDDPARPIYILNERGVGYSMPAPELS
ncbi:MAG: ATP-binding protein [Deltaproteobacteria bacterium]|nr:ATP-binding protein [Deltaproteobacteria bacterium]